MAKMNFSDKLTNLFSVINPLCYIIFKENPIVILFFPIIIFIIKIIEEYLKEKKDLTSLFPNLCSITIMKNYDCAAYNQICWYILNRCNVSKLELNGFYKTDKYSITKSKDEIPIFIIGKQYVSSFKFLDDIIIINCDGTTKVELYSKINKIENIKNLILYISNEYHNYLLNSGKKYHMFTFDNEYNTSEWKSTAINVIKNKQNVFLDDKNKIIFNKITKFYQSKDLYMQKGIPFKKGILLYGLPGTGKSSIIYALAYEFDLNIYKFNFVSITDSLFLRAIKSIPKKSLVVIEDIDTADFSRNRKIRNNDDDDDDDDDNDHNKKRQNKQKSLVNLETVLNVLDGYTFLDECLVVFTTNFIENLDKALIRPGRIDEKYEFSYATKNQIIDILNFYNCSKLKNKYIDQKITTAELIQDCLLI